MGRSEVRDLVPHIHIAFHWVKVRRVKRQKVSELNDNDKDNAERGERETICEARLVRCVVVVVVIAENLPFTLRGKQSPRGVVTKQRIVMLS